MTIEKTHYSNPASLTTHRRPEPYLLTGSKDLYGFKQCLDESKNNQQAESKNTQPASSSKPANARLIACGLYGSSPFALFSQHPTQADSVNLASLFMHTGIVNTGLGNNQMKFFKDLAAAKKFQKHFDNLVEYARFNCNISKIKECSTLIFESDDCATDKYVLSFDKSGYSLLVETKAQQFANDLSFRAEAFEGYFFNKTAYSLQIKVSVTE